MNRGAYGEQLAAEYLEKHGYQLVTRITAPVRCDRNLSGSRRVCANRNPAFRKCV